ASWPQVGGGDSQVAGRLEPAAAGAVSAHEIGIAPRRAGARPLAAVVLAAGPERAPREPQEHGDSAGVGPLALDRYERGLERVGHPAASPAAAGAPRAAPQAGDFDLARPHGGVVRASSAGQPLRRRPAMVSLLIPVSLAHSASVRVT